jgi:hypothetical protein
MKKILISVFVFLGLLIVVFIFSFFVLTRKTKDWQFIQSVGGISIEKPLLTEDGLYLPVICNVSGTDSITVKPTMLNSALSCIKIKSYIIGNNIFLKIVTGLVVSKKDNCNCKAISLGYLKQGKYKVYYGKKNSFEHQIGEFVIE